LKNSSLTLRGCTNYSTAEAQQLLELTVRV
jgi:hypothetical protein